MRRRPLVYATLVSGIASATFAVVACTTDYQLGLEDPRYGAPNALAGQKQPGPTSEATAERKGTNTKDPVCVQTGGTLVDGGACNVSFKNDIIPALSAANCALSGSCHGGESPLFPPRIDIAKPDITWTEFSVYKLSNGGTPYINPCSTDPTKSSFACNVNPTGTCGKLMPAGTGLPADVVTKIETWLRCGSPQN
jgi:hypothetical protein